MVIHLTAAGMLPVLPLEGRPLVLEAMVRPPRWVMELTSGHAHHACAVGDEVTYMEQALHARAMPLFAQGSSAMDNYRGLLDQRWTRDREQLRPGAWRYTWHSMLHVPPVGAGRATGGIVPDGAYVVCTCHPHQGCHLRWLAPHLCDVGWRVTLYGLEVRASS